MSKAIKITPDTMERIVVDWPEEGSSCDQLHWMQEQIGGWIEVVHPVGLERPYVMIVDEEGLIKDDPKINPIASVLYGFLEHGQPIAGTVLILREEPGWDGYELNGMTDQEADRLMEYLWPPYEGSDHKGKEGNDFVQLLQKKPVSEKKQKDNSHEGTSGGAASSPEAGAVHSQEHG